MLSKNDTMKPEIRLLEESMPSFNKYQKDILPLYAAENVMSEFVKLPLACNFQEKYIMRNEYKFIQDTDFIGSEKLLSFYKQISKLSLELFHAKYTDARTLTGMNCLNLLVSAKPSLVII
jgi:glycine/serine hydroxymethyltransferase